MGLCPVQKCTKLFDGLSFMGFYLVTVTTIIDPDAVPDALHESGEEQLPVKGHGTLA